jgi:DtxR family Mn-dependent transcriptional regulator
METGTEAPVPLSQLAQKLAISSVSVNQMVRKLASEGYLDYLPYKGVQLTAQGSGLAQRVLRYRRLWEVFLVDHLEISPSEAAALACRMEHITRTAVAEQLFSYLGKPVASPQGRPIPAGDGQVPKAPQTKPLSTLQAGQQAEVVALTTDAVGASFLQAQGLRPGGSVEVLGIGEESGMLLQCAAGRVTLSHALAHSIHVVVVR